MNNRTNTCDLLQPRPVIVDGVTLTIYHGVPQQSRDGCWRRTDAVIMSGNYIGAVDRFNDGERELVITNAVDGTGVPGLRLGYLLQHARRPVTPDLFMPALAAAG